MSILLALKIAGILLPAITAIISFTAKTKTDDGKLTREGRVQIAFMLLATILGGAVLLIENAQSRIASNNLISRMEALSTGLSTNLDASRKLAGQSETVLRSIEKTSDFVTRGDSWPEVVPTVGYGPDRASAFFGINVSGKKATVAGRTPLCTLNIDIIQDTNVDESGNAGGFIIFHQVFGSFFGRYDPSHMSQPQDLKGDHQFFEVRAYAPNSSWHQTTKMRKIGTKWEWRAALYIPGAKEEVIKVLQTRASAAFPPDDLKKPIKPITTGDIGPR